MSEQALEDRQKLRCRIDTNTWSWRIWLVASSGLLASSYTLFATTAALPIIAFVYFPDGVRTGILMNSFALLGAVVGQVVFGVLGDYLGRMYAYRASLFFIMVPTIYLLMSGPGYNNSVPLITLITTWRFFAGIGSGALFIATEWTPSAWRGPVVLAVFIMQPLGQALVQLVGLFSLLGWSETRQLEVMNCGLNVELVGKCSLILDRIWRVVIAAGLVPIIFGLAVSIFVPESGMFNLEVKGNPLVALNDIKRIYGDQKQRTMHSSAGDGSLSRSLPRTEPPETTASFSRHSLHEYFVKDRSWILFLGISAMCFLVELGFYEFGLDYGRLLADIWSTTPTIRIDALQALECLPEGISSIPGWSNGLPVWQTNSNNPCMTIYDVLIHQFRRYIATASAGSLLGGLCSIIVVNRIRRRSFLTLSFGITSIMFLVTWAIYYVANHSSRSLATVVMLSISHFVLLGPSSLMFLIPAEVFPTRYRCACYRGSAAAGSLGGILAVFLAQTTSISRAGFVLVVLSLAGAFGALLSYFFTPETQQQYPTKSWLSLG
ncbi:phosphate transporter [Diaporthe sp. PMI_573]|nr:phosphate transporter [Diaporthaceae sp. PMI_573]